MLDELEIALKKTKIVYQNYLAILQPAGSRTQTSTYWLQKSVEEYAEIAISNKSASWNPVQIKGRLDRYASHADIILCDKLNYCWSRFVGCKEMSHIIIDTKDGSVDAFSAINSPEKAKTAISQLIRLQSGGAAGPEINAAVKSEIIAMHCAIELLFPITERKLVLGSDSYNKDSNASLFNIANRYKMPKHYVELALSDNYMELIGAIAQRVDDEVFGN